MLFSHQFSSPETLNRARFWLTWHGFSIQEPRRSDASSTRSKHSLVLKVSFAEAAAVRALIGSIEHSEPAASTSVKAWRVDAPTDQVPTGVTRRAESPIHWESRSDSTSDSVAARTAEYMFSRWE